MLPELIDLLTCGDLEPEEVAEVTEAVENAPEDPDYEWAEDPATAMSLALISCLGEYTASSDKIDELHEQIQDMFSDPLPAFPTTDDGQYVGVLQYFQWLDGELMQRGTDKGGFDIVQIDDMSSDEMNMIVVYKKDTARILELADALGFRFTRPLDFWLAMDASGQA
jgi:hypothetical protein